MRLSLLQRYFIIPMCILLLILCQQQKSDFGDNDVWRPHMDAVICTLIQHPDQPLATDLSKIKFSPFRWDNIFSLFPVNSKIIIAFSNTSFMSSRHCVCIPLRLWESPWLGQANTSHCQSMYNTIEKEFFMDAMTFVSYCLAGFGGLVVVTVIGFVVYLMCDHKSSKKEDSDK